MLRFDWTGDDAGSSPWAFKIKMHVNAPSHVSGVVFKNSKFGNITSNSWQDAKCYPAIQMVSNLLPRPGIARCCIAGHAVAVGLSDQFESRTLTVSLCVCADG